MKNDDIIPRPDMLPVRIELRMHDMMNTAELYDVAYPMAPVVQCHDTNDDEVIVLREVERRYNLYPDMLAELEMLQDLLLGYAGHHQAKGDQAKADANMIHVYRIEDLLRKASPQ